MTDPVSLYPSTNRSSGAAGLVRLPWWRRFDVKVAALVGVTMLMIVIGTGAFAYRSMLDARLESFEQRLHSLALSLSETIDADAISQALASSEGASDSPALRGLHARLQRIVDQHDDIDSLYILRATDTPGRLAFLLDASKTSRVAQTGERYDASTMPFMLQGFEHVSVEDRVFGDEFGETQSAYAPLKTSDGRVIGIVGVDVLALHLNKTRAEVIWFCAALFGLALAAVMLLSLIVRRLVRRPLGRVLDAASAIAAGKLDTRLHAPSRDEFGLLANEFDTMARHLRDRERLRETFGLYVSRELAAALMKDGQPPALGGVECVATVIFCDLGNYTRISEAFSPQEVIALINEYLAAMSAVIESHQGCLLDFTGDGIIAGFGLPLPDPDHAHKAVQCALQMRQRLTQLNGEWEARGLASRWQAVGIDRIEARMGIHTGPLVAGNIGGPSRMKYCVMGDTVNIASRLEELNKDFNSTILVSDQVRIRMPATMSADFSDFGVVNIRGRVQAVGAYSV